MTDATSTFPADQMPDSITGPDGATYYRKARYTGTTIEGARRYGIEPGRTTYEYWIDPDDDSRRLQAVSPTEFWLD